jgi:hypothetical protein
VIHVWIAMRSIFDSGRSPHFLITCVRMIDASRAVVDASVFHDAIQSRACSPNRTRPACGET